MKVEIFTSTGKTLHAGGMVKIRVGSEEAVMTAGEWAWLLANPKHVSIFETDRNVSETEK